MTDPISLPFDRNESQLNEAVAAAMPNLIADLAISYTSGRPPKGLVATVTVSEAQIREAAIAHAKRLVNPTFRHFSVSFKATRGEDGMTTSIIASTHPIAPTEAPAADAPATAAAEPVAETRQSPLKDPEPAAEPAPVTEAPTEPEPTLVAEAEAPAAEAETAPWEGEAVTDAPAEASAEVEAQPEAAATTTEAATATEDEAKPAPAAGRSRLFADLQRPKND